MYVACLLLESCEMQHLELQVKRLPAFYLAVMESTCTSAEIALSIMAGSIRVQHGTALHEC